MFKLPTRHKRFSNGGLLSLVMVLALAPLTAHAAPLAQAPIHIAADRATFSQQTGVSTYVGDVLLTRGPLELRGDKLTVERDEDGSIVAVLVGVPARLARAPTEAGAQPITGRAERVTYLSASQVVELTGDAKLTRGGDTIASDSIRHNLATARTEAAGGAGERVRITIQPETAGAAADEATDAGAAANGSARPDAPE